MVHFTGLLENARHPVAGPLSLDPVAGPLLLDPCKNRVRAGIGGWPGTATGGQIHVVHISHTHPPKEIIQALRKYLLGKSWLAGWIPVVLGWLVGKPDYPQKLKVPEGYKKTSEKRNI